jgi:hypothetical protein
MRLSMVRATSPGSPRPSKLRQQAFVRGGSYKVLAPLAIGVVAAFLAFERLPRGTRRTLWAEDGTLFLADALRGNYDLLAAYAGYLHVIPRATALFVVHAFSVQALAFGMNFSACVITGAVASIVYVCAEDVVSNQAGRAWLALMTVLLPLVGVEIVANVANLHSVLMWGAFWGLLRHARTLRAAIALACFELLAALSEVQTAFLMPLALLLLWRRRDLRQLLVVAGCALGVAGQALTALTHEHVRDPHPLGAALIMQLLGVEVAMPLWVPSTGSVRELLHTHGWWLAVLAASPLLLGLGLSLRFGNREQRWAAMAAWSLGIVVFSASHMLNVAVMGGPNYSVLDEAPVLMRYAAVPSLLFLSALAIGTAAALRDYPRALGWLGAGSMVALLVSAAVSLRNPENLRDRRESWTRQIPAARTYCQTPGAVELHLRISPDPWLARVPCSRLRE